MGNIETSSIEFPSNEHSMPGYLAVPDDGRQHPGVVVIQEYWGLVPHIKEVTDRFANAGFIALAPDLYHGKEAKEPDEARKMSMALDRNRAVGEIHAAARYLSRMDSVTPKKIGVVGWCMGGGLALSAAAGDVDTGVPDTRVADIGTAVAFYGRPLSPEDTKRLRVPILGLYGENDHGIPVQAVREFESELKKAQVPHEIHIYPGAGHAFFNDTRAEAYRPEAAHDAWQRTLDWFHKYLK